jgi:hypothetical protein
MTSIFQLKHKKSRFHIEDQVKTLIDCEPYYSGYAGNPVAHMLPIKDISIA